MTGAERLRAQLTASLTRSGSGRTVADKLCKACVELLDIDGAAVSVMYDGVMSRSFGASSSMSRELDELQFTLGEGPCMEAVQNGAPATKANLNDATDFRWPGFTKAALQRGVQAVFALPVYVAAFPVGALDLYRVEPGELVDGELTGALFAAELATVPLLDLMGVDLGDAIDDESSPAWDQLSALTRTEVYQAAGMVIAQLGVDSAEALVRIRAYAYAHDMTASEVAYEIVSRRLRLTDDRPGAGPQEDLP